MTKDEALKLALEALEKSIDNSAANIQHTKAITVIKEALAQPEQDSGKTAPPKEWGEVSRDELIKRELEIVKRIAKEEKALAQPEQEPVVWMYQDKSTHEVRFQKHMRDFVDHGATYETPLYTTPPQRTWVGLTDEDVREVSYDFPPSIAEWYDKDFTRFIHTLEAKLKEKNT